MGMGTWWEGAHDHSQGQISHGLCGVMHEIIMIRKVVQLSCTAMSAVCGLSLLSLIPACPLLCHRPWFEALKQRGVATVVYGRAVNDADAFGACVAAGVDGICTDHPLALQVMRTFAHAFLHVSRSHTWSYVLGGCGIAASMPHSTVQAAKLQHKWRVSDAAMLCTLHTHMALCAHKCFS